ncbi:MAG TPA: Sec-independent protein translocase subunit TatA [Frankiaceae bacterium]|nr:Sec-independent protein translocase subunit TatA [Frankiaceae bacterium]
MFRDISAWHLALILLAFVVLFGYKKLPDATRSLGRSMRILKSEVKGLHDDEPKQVEPVQPAQVQPVQDPPVQVQKVQPVQAADVTPAPAEQVRAAEVPARPEARAESDRS